MSEDPKLDIALKFTSVLNYGIDKFPQSIPLKLFRAALAVKCALNPQWFIKITGPFFFTNREQIMNKNAEFFITKDYSEQREDWLVITRGYGESVAIAFEKILKQELQKALDKEPDLLLRTSVSAVKLYARYAQLCKEDNDPMDDPRIN